MEVYATSQGCTATARQARTTFTAHMERHCVLESSQEKQTTKW